MLITGFTYNLMYLLFFSTAVGAIVSNSYVLIKSFKTNFVPGYLAHIGLAMAMIGAGWSAGFENKKTIHLPQGQQISEMGYQLTFTKIVDNAKGFDCHVLIENEDNSFVAILPHEFPQNAEGVMKKPYVEEYFDHDLYVAPVAMEPGESSDPSLLTFSKGETKQIDKYTITFSEFELSSHEEDSVTTAGAKLTVEYDGKKEEIMPSISVDADSMENHPALFDYNKGQAILAGIDPDNGALMLQVLGDFVPMGNPSSAKLIIELSEKPWINFFWFGTILCFVSGSLSMKESRRKKKLEIASTPVDENQSKILA